MNRFIAKCCWNHATFFNLNKNKILKKKIILAEKLYLFE